MLFGLGAFAAPDREAEDFFERFRKQRLASLTNRDLEKAAGDALVFDYAAQFLLYDKRFSKLGDDLRAAIDDNFKAKYEEKMAKVILQSGSESDLIKKLGELEEHLRNKFTREGLDIISRKGDKRDLGRVRSILKNGFVDFSDAEIEYLRKYGEWEDIPLVVEMLERPKKNQPVSLLISSPDNGEYRRAAKAIYALGHTRFEELLTIKMPSRLLSYLLLEPSGKKFKTLSDESIKELFNSDDTDLRKAAALKCVLVLPKDRLVKLLGDYDSSDGEKYYNVIYWLDFGVSVLRDRARTAAKTEISRKWPT